MSQSFDITLVIGTFAGMLGGFYAITKIMLNQAAKDRAEERAERRELSNAIEHMAKSSSRVAEAAERGNKEAEIRNGHLAEQHAEIARSVSYVVKALKE